jgi:hypothetical protein
MREPTYERAMNQNRSYDFANPGANATCLLRSEWGQDRPLLHGRLFRLGCVQSAAAQDSRPSRLGNAANAIRSRTLASLKVGASYGKGRGHPAHPLRRYLVSARRR